MRPLTEQIQNTPNHSFKIGVYEADEICETNFWHIHPEYEIVYIHNGSGKRHIGNHISTYSDGELVMLGPKVPHLPLGNKLLDSNFEVVIQFTEGFIKDQLGSFPELDLFQTLKDRSKSGLVFGKLTKNIVGSYIKDFDKVSPPQRLILIIRLLSDLTGAKDFHILNVKGIKLESNHNDYNQINSIYNYVSENYDKEISLDRIARKIGLTKNSACRFFKKITGKTITNYVTEYRLKNSC